MAPPLSSPSSPVSLPPLPPPPSGYIQSWLAKGPAPHGDKSNSTPVASLGTLEAELASLGGPSPPKTAGKELLGRVLPRLAAYDVPSPASLETLCQMLGEAATSERFVVRYVHYFLQRSVERYGCAGFSQAVPGAKTLIDRLSADAKQAHAKHGARTVLAARALVAATRAGIPEAKTATVAALTSAANALRAGTQPVGGKKLKSMFSGSRSEGVDAGARAVLGASLRLGDAIQSAKGAEPVLLSPEGIATGVRSDDAVAARHAWSGVLALASLADTRSGGGTQAAHLRVATALCPGVKDLAGVIESRRGANAAVAAAPEEKSRAAAVKAARASEKDALVKYAMAPKLGDIATAALAMRACGALAGRLAADANDPAIGEAERGRTASDARTLRLGNVAALRVADGAARAAAAARVVAAANARNGTASTSAAIIQGPVLSSVFAMPRVALAAVTGIFAGDAPSNEHGARARATAWNAAVGDVGTQGNDGFDVLDASARIVTSAVLLGLDSSQAAQRRYHVMRAAACRAAAALGEARCASLAASAGSPRDVNSEVDIALAAVVDAVRRVADLETVSPGARLEALRATLWLQTPGRDNDAGEKAHAALTCASSGFEDFDAYEANVRRSGESSTLSSSGCVSDVWRGCDSQARLLESLARRCNTIAATASNEAAKENPGIAHTRNSWIEMTLTCAARIVASGPKSVNPKHVVDALTSAQKASIPGKSREQVVNCTAEILRSAKRAGAKELQTALTWHLGENVNFNCNEYAWEAETKCTNSAVVHPGTRSVGRLGVDAADAESVSVGSSSTAQSRNPCLAAAVSLLTRAALTSSAWGVRAAAVSGLATVALRSGEPFRVQCYCALLEMRKVCHRESGNDNGAVSGGYDFSCAEIERHVSLLDHMYRATNRFNELLNRNGDDVSRWPIASLAEVAGRHDVLLELATGTCFLPASIYAPLGGDSKKFANAFRGNRQAAAATASNLMKEESVALMAKVRKAKKKDGMTNSVVSAFMGRKSGSSTSKKRIEDPKATVRSFTVHEEQFALPAPTNAPAQISDPFVSADPFRAAQKTSMDSDPFASGLDHAPARAASDPFVSDNNDNGGSGLEKYDSGSFAGFSPVARPTKQAPEDDPFNFLG